MWLNQDTHLHTSITPIIKNLLKILLSLTIPKYCYSLSPKRSNAERDMGYAKICEEIKRGKCPEPRKRKEKE